MSLMIDELIKKVTKRTEASEGRSRSRKVENQPRKPSRKVCTFVQETGHSF